MAWREPWNSTGWDNTDHFWGETAEAVLDIRFWLGIILMPLVGTACWVLFILAVDPKSGLSWLTFTQSYVEWLAIFGVGYLVGPAIWIGIGVRCFSWDLADIVDDKLRPNSPDNNYLLRGAVLLIALTAVMYGVWSLGCMIGTWQSEPVCDLLKKPGKPSEVHGVELVREMISLMGCALRSAPSPSVWGTLAFSGPATVVMVAYFGLSDLRKHGKFTWLRRLAPGNRAAGDRSTLATVLDGAGQFSTEVGNTISKLVAFVKGGLWILVAGFVISLSWPPHEVFSWIIFGLGIVAGGKGLSYIGPAIRTRARRQNSKVHGDAGRATQDKTLDAARGDTEKPPWADHGYAD
jgi:hypothetical protein